MQPVDPSIIRALTLPDALPLQGGHEEDAVQSITNGRMGKDFDNGQIQYSKNTVLDISKFKTLTATEDGFLVGKDGRRYQIEILKVVINASGQKEMKPLEEGEKAQLSRVEVRKFIAQYVENIVVRQQAEDNLSGYSALTQGPLDHLSFQDGRILKREWNADLVTGAKTEFGNMTKYIQKLLRDPTPISASVTTPTVVTPATKESLLATVKATRLKIKALVTEPLKQRLVLPLGWWYQAKSPHNVALRAASDSTSENSLQVWKDAMTALALVHIGFIDNIAGDVPYDFEDYKVDYQALEASIKTLTTQLKAAGVDIAAVWAGLKAEKKLTSAWTTTSDRGPLAGV